MTDTQIISVVVFLIVVGVGVRVFLGYMEKRYIKKAILAFHKGYDQGYKDGVTEIVTEAMLEVPSIKTIERYGMKRTVDQGNLVFLIEIPMSKQFKNDYVQ